MAMNFLAAGRQESCSGRVASRVSSSNRSGSDRREYREFNVTNADTEGTLLVGMPTETYETVSSFGQEVSRRARARCGTRQ